MSEKITSRATDFPKWYQDIVISARMAEHSPVKGCMVIRPNGYAIWERIQRELDDRIKESGAENAYFPIFIPESFLKKEAEHVEGFSPQLAVVTYAGAKQLEENLVVRPTSETIINSMFSKWVQSYRDLPLLINQWANVVRWEMRTRLFLRTSEFLWQEGHTCHETPESAEAKTREMLEVYTEFCHNVLATPVLPGLKSDSERFAGALRTYSVEGMMQDRKALQAGTSHNLADNFAKAFGTQFLDRDGTQKFVHQTSWGVSTRLIGSVIMTHSDDQGLILPPRVAGTHIVMIPILGKNEADNAKVKEACEALSKKIKEAASADPKLNYPVRIKIDLDDTKKPGWKFHEYELTGIPIRIELGPRDLAASNAVLKRRDQDNKNVLSWAELPSAVVSNLIEMQSDLLEKATKYRDQHTHEMFDYGDFQTLMKGDGGFVHTSWCQSAECEDKVKKDNKATIRNLPLDEDYQPIAESKPCMVCGGGKQNVRAIFSKSY